ncbi:MAG: putative beta-lysine N-acetyltransferase [Oscillospiraceae bacterium]
MMEYGSYEIIRNDRCEAKVHVDPYNSRVRLLECSGDAEGFVERLKQICTERGFGKIICMVYERDLEGFISKGFQEEGKIDGFFKGETAYCMTSFPDIKRSKSDYLLEEDKIISYCSGYKSRSIFVGEPGLKLRTAEKADAENISELFRCVFNVYPTPMDQPDYVKKMMDEDVLFKVLESDEAVVSVASADMNRKFLHAEITDCATHMDFRGRGLMSELIFYLEQDLRSMGFMTVFSLARARSFGINVVLSKHGFEYSGRHINNCRIMDGFEDMNIWAKRLLP